MRTLACILGVTLVLCPQVRAQSGAVLFEGARLIVGDGSAPIENSAFLMENNRITRVARP
jgi:hypothetical protein